MVQTPDQVRHHYTVEKELSNLLREASEEQRMTLYPHVYDELYRRVPHHPMLQAKEEQAELREQAVQRKLKMLHPYLGSESVYMEIGAGDCLMSIRVAPRVAEVIALEVSSVIAERTDIPSNMAIRIISTPHDIPVDRGTVDLAYSDQLAEHLHPDDFRIQCENVFEALAPGGRYVIVTPNRVNGPHDVSRGFDDEATGMHLKEYTYTELHDLLVDIGFSRVQPIVGFRGLYTTIPAGVVRSLEALHERHPGGLSRWSANTLPMQMLFAIRLVATR